MAKAIMNTADIKIEQPDTVGEEREPTIVPASEQVLADKDYTERLALGEEAVTLRLNQGTERKPLTHYHAGVNGKGVEILTNGQWIEWTYAPVNVVFTTKVKYAAVWSQAKSNNLQTMHDDATVERPRNWLVPNISAVANYELIEASDRARHFLSDLRRRQA